MSTTYKCSACQGEYEVTADKVAPHYDDAHGTWHPPLSFQPAIAGWSKMMTGERWMAARSAGCPYCLKYTSARSCPAHGWVEKYKDGNRNRVRTPEEIAAEVAELKRQAAKKHPVLTTDSICRAYIDQKVTTGSKSKVSTMAMISEEIQDCRNYLQVLFPNWQKEMLRNEKKPAIRAAALAVGYPPKVVQLAMRDPHYFYIDSVNTYHGKLSDPDATWKTYNVVEKYCGECGWERRSHTWGDPAESWADMERRKGHIVITREEAIKICGIGSNENPCGHIKGQCDCAAGLVVGQLYEINRKDKPSLLARYVRWKNSSRMHEFKSDDSTWQSVKSEDVKTRVKGNFRNVPTKPAVAKPAVAPRNAFAAAQKQQVINRKARKASPNVDYQFRLYAVQDTGTDYMHALAKAAQSALDEKVDVKVTEGTIAALKGAIEDLTAWLGLFQEKAKSVGGTLDDGSYFG